MAVALLVMTAGSAAAANRGTATALAPQKPRSVPYTETGTCATISQTGSMRVIVRAGTNSTNSQTNVSSSMEVGTITR